MRVLLICVIGIFVWPVFAKEADRGRQSVGNFELRVIVSKAYITGKIYRKNSTSAIFSLKKSKKETPFANFALIDINSDGVPELEFTGLCNQTCEHEIFSIGPVGVRKIFSGTYSSVQVYRGNYVFSENSGCCTQEVQVFDTPLHLKKKFKYKFSIYRESENAKCESTSSKSSIEIEKLSAWLCSQ